MYTKKNGLTVRPSETARSSIGRFSFTLTSFEKDVSYSLDKEGARQMQTFTYSSDIDGTPITIENPLLPEHIKIGQILWYEGFTSMFSWSCPAIITQVDDTRKVFRVRSLDDMREQSQEYAFSVDDDHSTSRKSMRLVDTEVVKKYLVERKEIFRLSVKRARESLREEVRKANHFNDLCDSILFDLE